MISSSRKESESKTQFLVMSDAGKPIFSSSQDDVEVARQCSLFQGIRTSLLFSDTINLGDMLTYRTDSMSIVFKSIDGFLLAAISTGHCDRETELHLRIRLEYLYLTIIFSFTAQIKRVLQENPSMDLRASLGSTESDLRNVVQTTDPTEGSPMPFVAGSIPIFYPIEQQSRSVLSTLLQSYGQRAGALFAVAFVGKEVLSFVQSPRPSMQCKSSDLLLLLHCIDTKSGVLDSELWFPACLPRFNSNGFLHTYTCCIHQKSKLCIAFVGQDGAEGQFRLFQKARLDLARALGLSLVNKQVLKVKGGTSTDLQWSVEETSSVDGDDDYVDASGDGENLISYVGREDGEALLRQIVCAQGSRRDTYNEIFEEASGIYHFYLRYNAILSSAANKRRPTSCSHLSQVVGSEFLSTSAQSTLNIASCWKIYQRLGIRLRLGSSTLEAQHDALSMLSESFSAAHVENCPAVTLTEALPNNQGIVFMTFDSVTYLALNGGDFEMYASVVSWFRAPALVAAAGACSFSSLTRFSGSQVHNCRLFSTN